MIQVFIVEYRTGEAHNMRTHTFHFMTCTDTNVGMLHAWIKVLSILFYIPPCLFRITLLNAHIHMSHHILSYHVKIQFEFYFDDIKVTLDGVVVVVWCVLLLLKNRKSEAAKVLYLLPLSFHPCDPYSAATANPQKYQKKTKLNSWFSTKDSQRLSSCFHIFIISRHYHPPPLVSTYSTEKRKRFSSFMCETSVQIAVVTMEKGIAWISLWWQ